MPASTFHDRDAFTLENDQVRVTVLKEGGHIAEVFSKAAGVSPLWTPNWTGGEPSRFGAEQEAIFSTGVDAKLLYGIMGHNLCLDLFGGPTAAEACAGMTAHGEASLLPFEITDADGTVTMKLHMPMALLDFERMLTLQGSDIRIKEKVTNLTAFDRPLAWTQHVTLSPPFLDPKTTEFRLTCDRAVVNETDPGNSPYLALGKRFAWPHAPLADGVGTHDLQRMNPEAPTSSYAACRMMPQRGEASFVAWSPQYRLAFGYVWKRSDFPWLGIWEENRSRPGSPWNNDAVTRGMEFGVSPFPEDRRTMVERGKLLDTPTFRWLPARETLEVEYWIRTAVTDRVPEALMWPGCA